MTTTDNPDVNFTQEIRFAVVMYGGVSLAIYINGITQELLELVKATTPDSEGRKAKFTPKELSGSGKVYRKIGQILGSELSKKKILNLQDSEIQNILFNTDATPHPITTRFVIDILSGTSAGGINAIFLAKALANDQPLNKLKQLWIDEGDINKLINDTKSIKDDKDMKGVRLPPKPASLLNSQRMYLKLLTALQGMETPSHFDDQYDSPYVDELELFVTATDIEGRVIPIQLKDMVVSEKRHRRVFQFMFNKAEQINDFSPENTPFLAFVARCTSAFPLAFEPMTLQDAIDLLDIKSKYNRTQGYSLDTIKDWKEKFFAANCDELDNPETIAFGDGGYLDNKPFSYATNALLRRSADLPIKRHLIYIDPSPEHPEDRLEPNRKPNAIENSIAALLTLPRYETIREDIEQIINRNRIISRIGKIIEGSNLEEDVAAFMEQKQGLHRTMKNPEEGLKSLTEMVAERGISYGSYHRLKTSSVTDDLAKLITRIAGLNCLEESATFVGIRILLSQWRKQKYDPNKSNEESESQFLRNFDFDYRLRRLHFLRRKINQLFTLDPAAWKIIQFVLNEEFPTNDDDKLKAFLKEHASDIRDELKTIKGEISNIIKYLLLVKKCLEKVNLQEDNQEQLKTFLDNGDNQENLNQNFLKHIKKLRESIQAIGIQEEYLAQIREIYIEADARGTVESCFVENIHPLLEAKKNDLEKLATVLATLFKEAFDYALKEWQKIIKVEKKSSNQSARWVRKCIEHYYDAYQNYDMVIFPIAYGTDVGESDEIQIIRISSEDAISLVNERYDQKRQKLAGTTFFAFGGFFEQKWRENDILWGRLDGAERLISALLPGNYYAEIRQHLIEEAHEAILMEELATLRIQDLLGQMVNKPAIFQPSAKTKQAQEAIKVLHNQLHLLRDYFDSKDLYSLFKDNYQVDYELLPEKTLGYFSRSTQVFGKLLEGLSDDPHKKTTGKTALNSFAALLTRLSIIIWSLVELASPRPSILNISFQRYWISLIYLIEIFLIVVGFLLTQPAVQSFGLLTLSITLVLNLIIFWLKDFLRGGNFISKLLQGIFISIVGALIIMGGYYFFNDVLPYFRFFMNALLPMIYASISHISLVPVIVSSLAIIGVYHLFKYGFR